MENGLPGLAKILIFTGLLLLLGGLLLWGLNKYPGFRGMPGDMVFKKENFSFYFPLGTSILLSLLLTLFLYLWRKFGG
ncbi:Protein of unknown function [Cyclobacterium lianum]|uniref:DUF2905 domain-containing protein n=1 Tax=Cyclobacterium lianum TaxID=388280 RepID=A0A1M7PQA5_9BACT|nr:DUF2905 family protein [Cyclobacterium lianum]SHN19565.1 Protein of unknown function [Cyclobacterium lianum]